MTVSKQLLWTMVFWYGAFVVGLAGGRGSGLWAAVAGGMCFLIGMRIGWLDAGRLTTLLLAVTLLLAASASAEDKMEIVAITKRHFSGAVKLPDTVRGDQAVVRVFYWEDRALGGAEAKTTRLLLSKEFIIPVMPGIFVMFDEVPAPLGRVKSVEVTVFAVVSRMELSGEELQK